MCGCGLQLDINTVAAGGGSRLFFRSGLFVVGPESAGANPGPACYGKGTHTHTHTHTHACKQNHTPGHTHLLSLGGPLTVTDANLVLGRLLPE